MISGKLNRSEDHELWRPNTLVSYLMCIRKSTLFKLGCFAVGITYVLLSASILLQGVIPFMAQCGLPKITLESPHYEDAIFFHFFDMLVIGVLIAIAGIVESLTFQRIFSSAMLIIQCAYLYLDVQTSDTPLGNALYKGPNSVAPVVVGCITTLIFLSLTISAIRYRPAEKKAAS